MKTSLHLVLLAVLSLSGIAFSAAEKNQKATETPAQTIDRLVKRQLKKQKLKPNTKIDDQTFVRRTYLDISGRIPTIEEAEAFHTDEYPNKREKLIEKLLNSEGYVSNYYNFWADILRINQRLSNSGTQAEAAYQLWVKNALRDNMTYQEMVYELVRARGHIWDNGAAGYYQRDRGMPLDNMSNTVRVFLGTRLECAQCHNHPFDKWTQMDYFKMAAFSYAMSANGYGVENRSIMNREYGQKRTNLYREAVGKEIGDEKLAKAFPVLYRERDMDRMVGSKNFQRYLDRFKVDKAEFMRLANIGKEAVAGIEEDYEMIRAAEQTLYQRVRYTTTAEREKADLRLPHDYQYSDAAPKEIVTAATMFGADIDIENLDGSMIDSYAEWLTSKENPTFTKVAANRLWKRVFGMGVFEPVDELTDHTVVTNPELMDYLTELLQEVDYDMKAYLKILYSTNTYQSAVNKDEVILGTPYYFQGPLLRRMTAEQMWDSIVGLALPEADSYQPRVKTQLESVENLRLMYSSLADISPEEYVAMTKKIGAALADVNPEIARVRANLYKAREEDRMEDYQKIRKEYSALQSKQRRVVSDIAFTKLKTAVKGEELLAALGMSEMSMGSGDQMMSNSAEPKAVLTKLPKPKFPQPPADLDKAQKKRWVAAKKADYTIYTRLVAQMARASELQSPAPRGHFLREFGQSDREVIENASQNASVPQALNLLNGTIVEALTNEFAVFGNRLSSATDEDEKVRMIFQAMLTREPSKQEMKIAHAEIEAHGERAYEGLVWSLLNTQQFLFVQ